MDRFDVIVVGVGGMGSSVAYHLARQGKEVLGLEKFGIPHRMGSSHGNTRIIRQAYYEDPVYVPLVRRAYELWRDLEEEHGEQLLHITGSIDAGPPESEVFEGGLQSCQEYALDHEVLTGEEVNKRFPGYSLPEDYRAVYQPNGGFIPPERCIVAHVKQAMQNGAKIHAHESVQGWDPISDGVRVRTNKGTYEAAKLVITAGGWSNKLVDVLEGIAVPERITVGWFQPDKPDDFSANNFPVFHVEGTNDRYYGVPIHTIPGFKIGNYPLREVIDPDKMDRSPTPQDEALLQRCAERYFREVGPTMNIDTCIITRTFDENFILDFHPNHSQVVIGAGFSGRGFKFAPVVGEILSKLVLDEPVSLDIDQFSIDRFPL